MKNINLTVSLFDGMSSGALALSKSNLKSHRYYASEIDPFALSVAKFNFPNTEQLGDVRDLVITMYVSLLIGGSPCQSFSFSGLKAGMTTEESVEILTLEDYLIFKDSGFKFKGESYLFWEFVRVLKDCQKVNPDVYFLLENVNMSKKWESVITKALGVEPVRINSCMVVPQTRPRLYWCNFTVTQPEEVQTKLRDIIVSDVEDHVYLTKTQLSRLVPSNSKFTGKTHLLFNRANYRCNYQVFGLDGMVECLTTCQGGGRIPSLQLDNGRIRHLHPEEAESLQGVPNGYTEVLSKSQRYKLLGNGWTIPIIVHIFNCLATILK